MNIAAIPVRNAIYWTAPLVEHLLLNDALDEVWVYNNGSTDITETWVTNRQAIDGRLKLFNFPDLSLYEMWNHMIKTAADNYENANLAILNNDIRLPPFAIKTMANLMRNGNYVIAGVDPSRTGLYTVSIGQWDSSRALPTPIDPYCEEAQFGHRIGWAFMVAAEFWKDQEYAIYPGYKVWYGDDDLYRRAMSRGGRTCIVRGVGCDHAESQSDWGTEKWKKVADDKLLFDTIWSNNGTPRAV